MESLDKILSHLNYGSRKEVKEYIRKGYFMVNGETIYKDDFKVSPLDDEITFDGGVIEYNEFVYIMLNKPKDVISATFDPRYKTVIDLMPEYAKMSVFPVGRLDIDTEGLLIITNDGALAHRLLSPKYHVWKKYYLTFDGIYKEEYQHNFEEGIILDDGYKTLPARFEIIKENEAYIYIHEGKYHQVKRMLEALNMKVTYLKRVGFGDITLDNTLNLGQYRLLTKEEIDILKGNSK